jgi:hypothetical protein
MSKNSLRKNWSGIAAIAAALVASALMLAPIAAQGPGGGAKDGKGKVKNGPVRRKADGKVDISGYWATGGNGFYAAFDLEGRTGVDLELKQPFGPNITAETGGKIPYLPAAKAKKDDLFKNHLAEDPQAHCYPSGTPRQVYTPFGFQILEANDAVILSFEAFHAYRILYLSGKHPDPSIQLFQGDSRAHWEGDVLVANTKNLSDKTWFDMSGNFMIPSIEVEERFTPVDENTITYAAKIHDPSIYSRDWTISFPLVRNPDPDYETLEYACVEGEQDLQHYTESVGGVKKDNK